MTILKVAKNKLAYELTIDLDDLPKTPNARMHHMVRAKEVKKWRTAVYAKALPFRPDTALLKAHVTCTRFSSVEPDHDNLAASFKGCIDGLKDARIIIDDKPSVIGRPEYEWKKVKPGSGRIQITVRGDIT